MSAIFIRKPFNLRNLRRFLLYSSFHDSNLRVANPCLNRIVRHQGLATLAHNYKSVENSTLRENTEASHPNDSLSKAVNKALMDIDYNVQRIGRVLSSDVEKIFSMIVDLGTLCTKNQSLYLLRCCGLMRKEYPNERVELTNKIWKKLQDLGCQFDISHYNSILKVYIDNNHQFLPSDFLTSLESNGIEPNKVTFLHLMQKYCNDGDLSGSSEILEFMREKGLPINENVFNALITGHMNANDVAGAKDIFDAMRSSNLSPSAGSYTALACGYAKKRDIDGIKSVLQDVQNNNILLSNENFLSILSSLSSDEHLAFIDEVLLLMGENISDCRHGLVNTMIDLINKNLCASAYKILLALCSPGDRNNYFSNIFLQQLIKTKQPIEKVLQYCEEISSKGLNDITFMNSAKAAIDLEQFDYAISLYEMMSKKGSPVRTRNFWPILASRNSEEDVLSTLKSMSRLGVPADTLTFLKYVFPALNVANTEEVLTKIRETGHREAFDPLFQFYCNNGQSDQALYLIKKYPVSVASGFNLERLITSHSDASMRDPKSSLYQVLSFVLENMAKYGKDVDVIRGTYLADFIRSSPSVFQIWLKNSGNKGIFATEKCLNTCYDILASYNRDLLILLKKLEDSFITKRPMKIMAIEEEERQVEFLKGKGLEIDSFLQQRLSFHIRAKNIDRANQLIAELEKLGVVYTPFIYSQLFYFYKFQGNIEMTGKTLKDLREKHPHFLLDTAQVLEYSMMLVQYSEFEKALEIIRTECKDLQINGSKEFLIRAVRRLLDVVVETGDVDLVRNVQNSLVHHAEELKLPKTLFEPLIKVHLFRNDLDTAVQEFKSVAVLNGITPHLSQLMKKCIMADDHVLLETVINSASAVDGKLAVLHQVFRAFIESGRTAQAQKVLMNLGRKVEGAFLEQMCHRFLELNAAADLHDFLSTIGDFEHVAKARPKLYHYLFQLYDRRNECIKALELYNAIEKEKLFVVSDRSKDVLSQLCLRNNVAVPSTISERPAENKELLSESMSKSAISRISDASVVEFHDLLMKGDGIQALEKLDGMRKGLIRTLPLYDMTQFIKLAVENNLVQDLSRNVNAMSYIIENANDILSPLYIQYSEAGDIESMNRLASFLPDFTLKQSSYNGYMCKAYITSGKHEDLLKAMENRFQTRSKLFSAVSFLDILSIPDLNEQAVNLAKKYYEDKFDIPIAVFWAHLVINENYDAAEKLEKQFSVPYDKVDSIILRAVRTKENLTIARMYIDRILKQNIRLRGKERAYGVALDVLVLQEKYGEAADLMIEANSNGLNLVKHYRSTLITLRNALERENKPVPFTIPEEDSIIYS